ncbi:AI-2E family transporter, partial [Nostoc sp. NIES-2111]
MLALPQTRSVEPASRPEGTTVTELLLPVLLIAAVLYFAREILVPLALAVLLSFVLAPLLRKLQKWRIPRGIAVPFVVLVAFAIAFGLGTLVATQVTSLASDLPRYQSTIREKVQDLKGMTAGQGTLTRAAAVLRSLGREISGTGDRRQDGAGQQAQSGTAPASAAPHRAQTPAAPPEARQGAKPIP